ncbi:MAG TPA: ABC transporter substrate-binding protein [Gaiellaceae bacterium]|nr:ABC transporter substrate-binding protein [Gaiellaceae bacterium]
MKIWAGATIAGSALAAGSVVALLALTAGGAGASSQAYPRSQTLYMSGNQWSPNNDLNPVKNWDYVTGLVGFAYETPFRYDPLKGKFIPWLASKGVWQNHSTYVMTVRKGVKWSDGKSLTPQDFLYTFNTLKLKTHPQHPLWADTGLKSIKVKGQTLVFTFGAHPGYQQFDFYRFNVAIVPQHVFKKYSNTDLTTGNLKMPIVGTGPYLYKSGYGAQSQTVAWAKNPNWWATKALGLKVAPKYIIDIKNGTNAAALGNFVAGNIDLFNNFAPKSAISGSAKTYYGKAPYHLAANTVWLFPNTQRKPLNDPAFRRALADSINVKQIIDKAYQGLVNKASPTGLLPIWDKWIDNSVVQRYGFSFNATKAKNILKAAGYKDVNHDGYVENKDGSPISLSIVCPNGWSDWMTAIQIVAADAKAAGIKITPSYPEYATMTDDRGHGNFDLLLGNDRQYSNTPWTYYQYIYQLPITGNQTTTNYERYKDSKAWNLTTGLDRIPSTNPQAIRTQMAALEKRFLQNLPAIPLWYNGMWAMFNTKHWTNWPSSSTSRQYTTASWRNYFQMTGIDMLTHLKPTPAP